MTADESTLSNFDPLWDHDDPQATEERFRALLREALASNDPSYLAELLTQIARAEGLQQRFDDAHRTLDQAVELLPSAGPRARIRFLLERGSVLNSSQRKDEARPVFLQAWDLAREQGEDFYAVDVAHMMAIIEPPEQQLEWTEQAMHLASQSSDPRARGWLGSLYNNSGWIYHDAGRYEDALATFQAGLEWQTQAGKEEEARIAAGRSPARYVRSAGMTRRCGCRRKTWND